MKDLLKQKWFIEIDKFEGAIKIKADNSANTPICRIATPIGRDWLKNEKHFDSAMQKAKLIEATPDLLNACKKLIEQIEMSDYIEPDGHHLSNNISVKKMKEAIQKALS